MANQVGTVIEAIEAVKQDKDAHWGVMVSYRYGDTDDSFIADLVVGVTAGQIKVGAPCRGECLTKYNQVFVECLPPFMWLHARKYWSKVIVPYVVIVLRMLWENRDMFDLVISDVHMPDMDGFKLLDLEMDLCVIRVMES
ncbi:hypothetical protein VPH35_021822 [Triticum aestivum]